MFKLHLGGSCPLGSRTQALVRFPGNHHLQFLAFVIFCMFGGDGLMGLTSCPESVLVLRFDSRGDKTLLHTI